MRLKFFSLFSSVLRRGVMPFLALGPSHLKRSIARVGYTVCWFRESDHESSLCSSDADTTALSVHARGNVHGCKLLEHELGGVWNDDLCNLGLVLARSALELVLLEGTESVLASLFQCLTLKMSELTQ